MIQTGNRPGSDFLVRATPRPEVLVDGQTLARRIEAASMTMQRRTDTQDSPRMGPRRGVEAPDFGISGFWSYFKAFGLPAIFFHLLLLFGLFPSTLGAFLFVPYFFLAVSLLALLLLKAVWGCAEVGHASARGRTAQPLQRLRIAIGLAALASVASAVMISRIMPRPLPSGSHHLEFDREAWSAKGATDYVTHEVTPRQKMLGSLVDQLTPQMDRTEIEEWLGPPAPPGYPHGADGSDLHYFTGLERDGMIGLDGEWLLIYLDENGKYSRYRIYTD